MKAKVFSHPISRVVLRILSCLVVFVIAQNVAGKLLELANTGKDIRNLIKGIIASAAVILYLPPAF